MVLNETEQLALLGLPSAERRRKASPLPVAEEAPSQRERVALENRHRDLFEHRLDWGRLVTYVPNKRLPLYNWFKYRGSCKTQKCGGIFLNGFSAPGIR